MHRESNEKHLIKKPYYEGGKKALDQFIKQHLKYPKEALEKKIEGSVHVTFEISTEGKVITAKSISSLGGGCDEEAVRLVKMLRYKVPKNPRKLKIKFNKKIQIHFRLPKTPLKNSGTNVRYNYSHKPKEKAVKPAAKPNTYSYTIKW